MTVERTLEERARVSAPCMRTFLNIARRWRLSEEQQASLLACSIPQLREWGRVARDHKPLALETPTLMRLSAVLGVFAELRHFLMLVSGAREEREWLVRPTQIPPFNGRRPLEALFGSPEDQIAVRRYLAKSVEGASLRAELDLNNPAEPDDDTAWSASSGGIKAVCFDAFGTVVEVADKRRPFQSLLRHEPSDTLRTMALTRPMGLRELASLMTRPPNEKMLTKLEADVVAECTSTRLRQDMERIWTDLRRAGLRIAICSNLAQPYQAALLNHLPGTPDAVVLSFRVGLVKPQQQIYRLVCRELGLRSSEVLFTGDDLDSDVFGPAAIDALAMPIEEFENSYSRGASFFAPREVRELFAQISAAQMS